MTYLNSLYIKKFRAINNLELNHLSRINILVGDNNCGKTSVLEAISLFQNPTDISNILINCSKRGRGLVSTFDLFLEVFPRENENRSIEITSTVKSVPYNLNIEGKLVETLNAELVPSYDNDEYYEEISVENRVFDGSIRLKKYEELVENKEIKICEERTSSIISDSTSQIINMVYVTPYDYLRNKLISDTVKIIKCGEKEEIVKLLKMFDNNIEGFEILPEKNKTLGIYIKHNKYGLMSLSSFGDGVKKILILSSSVVSAKNGILLIDEIETAIYKSIMKDVFGWLINACKIYKVQLIATTHSLEVIDAFIETANNIDKLTCFRLEHHDNYIYTNRLGGQKLKDIRCILGQDVR
ncbi:MAG: AAA family ATPase [Peptostreptococcaceae bacterium]